MRQGLVIGDIRVQEVIRGDGRVEYTVLEPDGAIHKVPDAYLRSLTAGTSRTYAYLLVDHLRWLVMECLDFPTITFADLERYMGAVGAEYPGPFGQPWRSDKKPYRQSTLEVAAACLKGFYVHLANRGVNTELGEALDRNRLPTTADRRRAFLGHTLTSMPANPIAPNGKVRRRHPKMLPEGAKQSLPGTLRWARDRMIVSWLGDGGFRVGELCGLHLVDLHLRKNADCGECREPHVHICHRETNTNRSRVKVKDAWEVNNGIVRGGTVRRASPGMIHTHFDYMTTQYPRQARHGMLLVQLQGPKAGDPLATAAVRSMLKHAGIRLKFDKVLPKEFRHTFTSEVLDAAKGNAMIAKEAGGWRSAAMVDEVYGHVDVHDPVFAAALERTWGL
ncbi:tyrosine-type recombinase/integrase [Kitasatospora sp. NPDC001547]|uniref:tyrosine-type recombinase/integrase n=1 Tax=Kitasatospora sp. NPDC001547 TaxID=3364015 RepID=UPI0036C72DC4